MVTFNMTGQTVNGAQNNVAGNFYAGSGEGQAEVISRLRKLQEEIAQSHRQGSLSTTLVTDAETEISKAVEQAGAAKPNQQTLLDHINTIKGLFESVQGTASIVGNLATLAQIIRSSL